MYNGYNRQPRAKVTRRGRHVPAASLDPTQLADLVLRSMDGPASPVASTLISSQYIDSNTLSTYTQELIAQAPHLLATEANPTLDSRVTTEVVNGLLQVSRRFRSQPKTSRSRSGTMSLRDITARIEGQACSLASDLAPSPPTAEIDESISEWNFDDEFSPEAATEFGRSLDVGSTPPVAVSSPQTPYYSLDIEDATLLFTPLPTPEPSSPVSQSDGPVFPDPPEATLPSDGDDVNVNATAKAADGERTGEAVAALLTTADRMIATSTLVLLHHIARLDASIMRAATTPEPRAGHCHSCCQCQTSQVSASGGATKDDEAHSHIETPFAVQEVHAPQSEGRDVRVAQGSEVPDAPSEVPRSQQAQSTPPASQDASATQTLPRGGGPSESATADICEPRPNRQRRNFVRILQPTVRVGLPQYVDAEVQAGRGLVQATRGTIEERYPSFVAN